MFDWGDHCIRNNDPEQLCEQLQKLREEDSLQDAVAQLMKDRPELAADWPSLRGHFGDRLLPMILTLCLVTVDAGVNLGTSAVLEMDPLARMDECFRRPFLQKLGMTEEDYFAGWMAVHYLRIEDYAQQSHAKAVSRAVQAYAEAKLSKERLLTDILIKRADVSKIDLRLHRDCLELRRKPSPERGVSERENRLEQAVYMLSRTPATDIIQHLYYRQRDDGLFECSYLLRAFRTALEQTKGRCMVVNPSPAFLLAATDVLPSETKLAFVVRDLVIRELYRLQFPGWEFISGKELDTRPEYRTDLMLIMARDNDLAEFGNLASHCAEGAQLIAMIPEVSVADHINRQEGLFTDAGIQRIVAVPKALSQSLPRKKVVVFAQKGCVNQENVDLLFCEVDATNTWLIPQKKIYKVLLAWVAAGKSAVQMKKVIQEREDNKEILRRNSASSIWFSREISLEYSLFSTKNSGYRGRACYRAILRPVDKTRQHGSRLTVSTEKGLRGNTREDVVHRLLGEVPFYEAFQEAIVSDVLDYYAEKMYSMSLKTLWYCSRPQLLRLLTYDDDLARELFGPDADPALPNWVPGLEGNAEIGDLIEAIAQKLEVTEKRCWALLNLVLDKAKENGYISFNPLGHILPVLEQKERKALQQLRSNLAKYGFSSEEESRMLRFLLQEDKQHHKRCVRESIHLCGAIRLFTGMPVREICALRWKDFGSIGQTDGYQLQVVRHLDKKDRPQPIVQYHNEARLRKVALAPLLAQVLLERKRYIQEKYRYPEEGIREQPIILQTEPKDGRKRKLPFCSRAAAKRATGELLEKAQIPKDTLTLLDGERRFETELSRTSRDLFYTHFQKRASMLCGFTQGQLNYTLGRKAEDTLSRHYIDYGNDFIQYDMVCRLNRWTCGLGKQANVPQMEVLPGSVPCVMAKPADNNLASVEIDWIPETGRTEDHVLQIHCDHGLSGRITVYEEKGEWG